MDHNDLDKKLDKALSEEPKFFLSESFTTNVISRMEAINSSDRRLYWFVSAGTLLMLITCIVTLMVYFRSEVSGMIDSGNSEHFELLPQYGGWLIMTALIIAGIQVIDKKFIVGKTDL